MMTRAAPGIPSSFIRVPMYASTALKSVRLSCAKDRRAPNATKSRTRIIPLKKAILWNISATSLLPDGPVAPSGGLPRLQLLALQPEYCGHCSQRTTAGCSLIARAVPSATPASLDRDAAYRSTRSTVDHRSASRPMLLLPRRASLAIRSQSPAATVGEYIVDSRLPDWLVRREQFQAASQAGERSRNVLTQLERKTV